jgi:ribonuclease J
VVIITTGSQGEPMSVLSRIATDEHKQIKIKEGDTIVLSAKMIPGNERSIGKIINHLFRRGANVIYEKVSEVHVSGHASKEELKLMLNLIKPKYFMPVHGEYRHLIYHSMLAKKMDIPKENIFIMKNGDVLELSDSEAGKSGNINAGRIYRWQGLRDVEEMVLRDRLRLAHDGIVPDPAGDRESHRHYHLWSGDHITGFVFEDASRSYQQCEELLTATISGLERNCCQTLPAEGKTQSTSRNISETPWKER